MIGQSIAHYQVLEKLGEGGMGAVYKARDTHLDRHIALKILRSDRTLDSERKRRFIQEAKAASALNHPNIVHIYDIDSADNVDFIAMEYVSGETLAQLIQHGVVNHEVSVKYAVEIADALSAAHATGIVHRDLKPGNIMVTEQGRIKLVDFGLAKLTEPAIGDVDDPTQTAQPHTLEGVVLGTIGYMSPEQISGKKVDNRSDIFSFGVVLYEMLIGRKAFQRENSLSTLQAILTEEPEPCPARIPASLQKVIKRCLCKDPNARFQNTADLKLALQDSISPTVATPSIAVLPFANLSKEEKDEYFSDGLAEEIINALTRVRGLRVTSRTSAFAFRGKDMDVRDIGIRLNVNHILEGSFRRAGDKIRITAQLINVADGCHVWSERYDGEMTDVFALQDNVARAITDKLRGGFSSSTDLVKVSTKNLGAYQLYLEGRHHLYKWTPEAFQRGRQCLERAIALDPEFALAYDSLSELHWFMGFFGLMPPKEAFSVSTWATLRALEIDDSMAEAHAQLGMLRKELDYNWPEVQREFRRALQINPESPTVRLRYAISLLLPQARLSEAAAEIQSVLQSDPLSLFTIWWLTVMLYLDRRFDLALAQVRRILDLDPAYYLGYWFLGFILDSKNMSEEAVDALRQASRLSGRAPVILGWLALMCGHAGKISEAKNILTELETLARNRYVPASSFAWAYLGLDEIDLAFDWLEKAIDSRDPMIIPLKSYPFLDPLRSDKRYEALARKMNLEP